MQVERVTADDERVGHYRNLTDVQWRLRTEAEHGLFLAEGTKVIGRALDAGYTPYSVLTTEKWLPGLTDALAGRDVPVLVATEDVLRDIVGFRLHRGALAAYARKPPRGPGELLESCASLVVLEDLVDHTNVGLIMRTAAAVGIEGALLSPRCADPYYRRAVKTSMGAVLSMPWAVAPVWPAGLGELRERGFETLALTPDEQAESLLDWRPTGAKVALLFGTEGPGLSQAAMAATDRRVRIPVTSRVDSLNVAAAAAIGCFTAAQALAPGGRAGGGSAGGPLLTT